MLESTFQLFFTESAIYLSGEGLGAWARLTAPQGCARNGRQQHYLYEAGDRHVAGKDPVHYPAQPVEAELGESLLVDRDSYLEPLYKCRSRLPGHPAANPLGRQGDQRVEAAPSVGSGHRETRAQALELRESVVVEPYRLRDQPGQQIPQLSVTKGRRSARARRLWCGLALSTIQISLSNG